MGSGHWSGLDTGGLYRSTWVGDLCWANIVITHLDIYNLCCGWGGVLSLGLWLGHLRTQLVYNISMGNRWPLSHSWKVGVRYKCSHNHYHLLPPISPPLGFRASDRLDWLAEGRPSDLWGSLMNEHIFIEQIRWICIHICDYANDSSGHPFSVAGVVIIRETDLFATCVLIEATAAAAAAA